MNGDNTPNNTGVYGTIGIANAANKPGARNRSTSWTDASGRFWLFGGFGFAADIDFSWARNANNDERYCTHRDPHDK